MAAATKSIFPNIYRSCESCRQLQSLLTAARRPRKGFVHATTAATYSSDTSSALRHADNASHLRNFLQHTPSRPHLSQTPRSRPRHFSSSSRTTTAVITNPRKDEDGKEMTIEITPRAATRLKQIMTKDANSALALRVSVESGGCHGFQYLMSLTDMGKISLEDDTVFEEEGGARVVMDEPSLELLKGSKVDFTTELIGSQFKIVDNPLATSSCGCGTSFDIKI